MLRKIFQIIKRILRKNKKQIKALSPSKEAQIIQTAYTKDGVVSLADIVAETSLSEDTAESLLQVLIMKGYADIEVLESGDLVYQFNNIENLAVKTVPPVSIKGFTFQVVLCEKQIESDHKSSWVDVHLLITSKRDALLKLYTQDSRIIDHSGHSFSAKKVFFGGQTFEVVSAKANLPKGVGVKAIFRFNTDTIKVSSEFLSLLEFFGKTKEITFKVQIKAIPMSKRVVTVTRKRFF